MVGNTTDIGIQPKTNSKTMNNEYQTLDFFADLTRQLCLERNPINSNR